MPPLKLFALNCSLKKSVAEKESSTDKLLSDILAEFDAYGGSGEIARAADFDIKPGVTSDEGHGDAWPSIRQSIIEADIFILGTPIWMGQPSSVTKRALERLDAFLGETDEAGRMPAAGKVALVAVVGNEDGAHHCHAACFQALNDVGFTVPANAGVYWVGEAMGSVNYVDLPATPPKVVQTIKMAVSNAAHLARQLQSAHYPGVERDR